MRVSSSELRVSEAVSPTAVSERSAAPPANTGESSFARVLRGIGQDLNRGEASTRAAIDLMRRGGDLAPGQLIALQAGVYRYSEAVDLVSRLVDRTTSGVKTVLQGSGQ
jgi:hypothetical protein